MNTRAPRPPASSLWASAPSSLLPVAPRMTDGVFLAVSSHAMTLFTHFPGAHSCVFYFWLWSSRQLQAAPGRRSTGRSEQAAPGTQGPLDAWEGIPGIPATDAGKEKGSG